MRDNNYLKNILDQVWRKYFSDIPRANRVLIFFGQRSKRRLASIRQKRRNDKLSDTEIRVTAFYSEESVPEEVIIATIAHELVHYAHGFASPLPQFFKYPHKGDIVDKEMQNRGLAAILAYQKNWLAENWEKTIKNSPKKRLSRRKITRTPSLKELILKSIKYYLS